MASTDLEGQLEQKLERSHAKKEAKAKEARLLKHDEEVKMIEERKFEKEMEREDLKIAEDVARFTNAEIEGHEAMFLAEYESLLAGRRFRKEKKVAADEKAKLAKVSNPNREWRCNGCNKTNHVAANMKKKIKKKKKKKKVGAEDDEDEEEEPEEKEEKPEPVTRCHYCGVPHTYIPRGKRGAMVLAANALEAAYVGLGGDDWHHHKGWIKASRLSDWHGITADDQDDKASGAVLKLDLVDNNLKGELPLQLFRLGTLTHLLLDQNDIHGQIPEDIANLSNLKYLDLGGCKLTGPLPLDMWHSMNDLKTLSLNGNAISGTLPDSLSKLESLQSLWMQDNKLCGSIPPVGALDELRLVDLGNNALGGDLPYDINGCRELRRFDVSNNFLTGLLPGAFAQLYNLTDLNLSHNSIGGAIHAVSELEKLVFLNLSHNKFDGKLPNFEPLFFLTELRLNDNRFRGPLTETVTTLEKLTLLEVQENALAGDVPTGLKKLKHLSKLDLTGNRFDRYSLAECRISLEKHLPNCVRNV